MRAVEKNILVVSTCELRSKREETIVNGVPERWENGKESDINMDLVVDKSNVITDTSVLNGNETVESLLNELESMKTPETKLNELKTEQKEDHIVAQVTDKDEPNLSAEEPKLDIKDLTNDTPQTQITYNTEDADKVNTDVVHDSVIDLPQEQNSEIQPVEVKEQIAENIEELKDLSTDVNIENIEPKIEEPIIEINKLEPSELILTDTDRVEGSIIHQTPDADNKVELVIASQPEVVLEKPNETDDSMDVQVEDVIKSIEPEVSCESTQEKCTEATEIEKDKQQEDKSNVDESTVETTSLKMDVELEKIEDNNTNELKTVSISEETKKSESDTSDTIILEEPQGQDENKLTESE